MTRDALFPLVKRRKRARFLVVDIETKDGETQDAGFTRPFMAGLYDGERYLSFRGPDCLSKLCRVLLTPTYNQWRIYAHAGGSFDYLHMMHELLSIADSKGMVISIVPVSSTIQAIKIEQGRNKWLFLDSYKLIPLSLAKAGKSFGGEQKLADHDLDLHEDDPRWDVYLKQDCIALHSILTRYYAIVEKELRGEVGVTAASTAMRTFRRGYQKAPIDRHCEEHEFIRAGYYGGNTQAFVKHATGLHYYDLNSSYPAAMLGPVPTSHSATYEAEEPPAQHWHRDIGFCDVLVSIDSEHPCLPWRCPESRRLLFPRGTFRGVWSSEELAYAMEHHSARIVEWFKSVWYHTTHALEDYVSCLYAYRDKSSPNYDEGVSTTAKLNSNSLYGKFGMNAEREQIIILQDREIPPEGARPASANPDCRVWYVTEDSDADYVIPQIAATITARARIQLQKVIDEAAKRGLVAYCDTDSVITTANLDNLCSTKLGALKDEGAGDTFEGWFLQPKLYCLRNERTGETKVAMKGYRRPTAELFERVRNGETIVRKELEKLGALAKVGFTRGPLMREVKKRMVTTDQKRLWREDGTSSPLTIEQQGVTSPERCVTTHDNEKQ